MYYQGNFVGLNTYWLLSDKRAFLLRRVCMQWVHASNKGVVDQPAHRCGLLSAFLIRLLESIIANLATCKLSIF